MRGKKITSGALLAFVALGAPVFAAPNAVETQPDQVWQNRAAEASRSGRLEEGRVTVDTSAAKIAPTEAATHTAAGAAFTIEEITLTGLPEDGSFSWVAPLLHSREHTRMDVNSINELVKAMNTRLLEKGYVTSQILIPEQNLQGGRLRLLFLPGKLHRVIYAKDSAVVPWRNAFPIREGDILNVRLLEQGLEQMKRLSSLDVTMKLLPAGEPGATDVELLVRKTKPIHVVMGVDDSGLSSTGKLQVAATVGIDNLLHANDVFSVTRNGDGASDGYRKGTRGTSLFYSIPYGRETFSLFYNHYNYHQYVGSNPVAFIASGKTDYFKATWDHMFRRNGTTKWDWDMSIITRNSHQYINGTEINVQALRETAFEGGISVRHYSGPRTLYGRVAGRMGTGWFGANPAIPLADAPATRYKMLLLDLDYRVPLTLGHRPAAYTVSLHGQYTGSGKRLYGVDGINIGNRYTVRGFDGEYTLLGESGWYVRQELSSSLPKLHSEVYVGLDLGAVYGPSTDVLVGHTIAGTVLGVRGTIRDSLFYDAFVGVPLVKPEGYPTDSVTAGFSLSWRY